MDTPESRWNYRLVQVFLIGFMLLFTIVVLNVIFNNGQILLPALCAAVMLAVMIGLYRWLDKIKNLERFYYLYLFAFAALLFTLQMLFGHSLRYQPQFDLEAIYRNAIEWAQTGRFAQTAYPTSNQDYFYFFPNNLGGLAFLALFFKLGALPGIHDYFGIAMTVNGLMLNLTLVLSSLIVRRWFGTKSAVMILILFLLCPPLYFAAPLFYTDYLSLLFPVLTLYLCLRAMDSAVIWQRLLFLISSGSALAVGTQIKATVGMAGIAIVLWLLLKRRFRWLPAVVCTMAASLLIVSSLLAAAVYPKQLDPARAERENTPLLHWVMMGLSPSGGYNPGDYEFTRSFADTETRDQAILREIKARVQNMGVMGLTGLFLSKNAQTFGDGTFAQSDFLDDAPENVTMLHDFLLYHGRYYTVYQAVCTGVFIALLIFTIVGAYQAVKQPENRYTALMPQLCLVGITLFLLVWELNARYLTTMLPMFFLTATQGIAAGQCKTAVSG